MKKLQQAVPVEIRMVSFSVDPARDTPKALAAYAAEHGATRDRSLIAAFQSQSGSVSMAYRRLSSTLKAVIYISRFRFCFSQALSFIRCRGG